MSVEREGCTEVEGMVVAGGRVEQGRSSVAVVCIVTSILAIVTLIFYCYDPAVSGLFWRCPFHRMTGWLCPGCGTQRAVHALLHGKVVEAVSSNALSILVVLPLAAWGYLVFVLRSLGIHGVPEVRITGRWLAVLLGMAVVFGLLRNLPWEPFLWLAP